MAVRILMLAVAVGLLALGAGRAKAHRSCYDGSRAAFAIGAKSAPVGGAAAVGRTLIDHCRGAKQLTDATTAFLRVGALQPAATLAEAAVRREPQRRDSWLAEAGVDTARGDMAGARQALDRARDLDPLSFRR